MSIEETPPLEDRIAAYLEHLEPAAAPVRIEGLKRFHGGSSRETFRFTAHDGRGRVRGLVLRRDPSASLIDTERTLEFRAYQSFHGTLVPVPEPVALETDDRWLGRPFFLMEEIEGGTAASPFAEGVYAGMEDRLGHAVWTILGTIAGADALRLPLAGCVDRPDLDGCWRRELDYWEGVIDTDELEPQPIVRAAIRFLRRNPPPPAPKLSVVHGDFRSGNFLYGEDGTVRAVLDWEMAHLGDPHEDLAWAMDPLWSHNTPDRPAGLLPRGQALRLWQQASGLLVNEASLRWWSVFAALKGMAIWISAAKEYSTGANTDPVLAFSGLYCATRHNAILVDALEALR